MTDTQPPTLTELSAIVDDMIESINRLPPHAMIMPINNYDQLSILFLFKTFLSSMSNNQALLMRNLELEAVDLGSVADTGTVAALGGLGNSSSSAVTLPPVTASM